MRAALLADRGVVNISGEDARRFLNGLLTIDMAKVGPDAPRYGALLTPQGKIISDCIVVEGEDGFLLDCSRDRAGALAERLRFYKLRAKVAVEDRSNDLAIVAVWEGTGPVRRGLAYADPRVPALGLRILIPRAQAPEVARELGVELGEPGAYETHRITLGIPRGGVDFLYGDAFPHEADLDQLAGVDFDKGCYVGQEVVSRIEHRARARTRVIPVVYDGSAPAAGVPVGAGEKVVGTMGSSAAGRGLARLRLDWTDEALARGTPLRAADVVLRPAKPAWARFPFPGEMHAES
jgi:tRNA-modifying protein YgfZ